VEVLTGIAITLTKREIVRVMLQITHGSLQRRIGLSKAWYGSGSDDGCWGVG
jgi:hypothetical protein